MEFRSLRVDELERWYDHCAGVFVKTGRDYFVRHYLNDPQSCPEDIFIAVDGHTIAATVRVFRRKVYLAGRAVRMGGIGEVSTKEEYRRKGLSGRLLEMAIAHMEALDMPISALFTDNFTHYGRYGWFRRAGEAVLVKVVPSPLPEGYSLRPFQSSDLPRLRALYDLYAPRFNGAVVRDDPTYWERWVAGELSAGETLVLSKGEDVQAYLILGKPKEKDGAARFSVREFAAAPDAQELLAAFLAAAAERFAYPMAARMAGPLWTFGGVEGREETSIMLRLNKPFWVDTRIDSNEKLAAAYERPVFFGVDGF